MQDEQNEIRKRRQVYFIGPIEGPVKIGYSHRLHERFISIQVGSPVEVFELGAAPGGRAEEHMLHKKFEKDRLRGEWFKLSEELSAYISEVNRTKSLPDLFNESGTNWRAILSHIGRHTLRFEFGVSDTAISLWVTRGVPKKRQAEILRLAEGMNIDLSAYVK